IAISCRRDTLAGMSPSRFLTIGAVVALGTGLAACGSDRSSSSGSSIVGPGNVASRVDNPWYPLAPGTVLRYRGVKEGVPMTNVVTVMHATKRILGVPATVVRDRVYVDGRVSENTVDWFAQD